MSTVMATLGHRGPSQPRLFLGTPVGFRGRCYSLFVQVEAISFAEPGAITFAELAAITLAEPTAIT